MSTLISVYYFTSVPIDTVLKDWPVPTVCLSIQCKYVSKSINFIIITCYRLHQPTLKDLKDVETVLYFTSAM